jgi:adenylate cyclase
MPNENGDIDRSAVADVVSWLNSARRFGGPRRVLAELCQRLSDAGVTIHRAAVFVRTLHPSVMGRRFSWKAGEGVTVAQAPFEILQSDEFKRNPIGRLYQAPENIRRRLCDPECPNDYKVLDELRAEGATDYLIMPLFFSNGEIHAISWTSDRPNGFLDDEVSAFQAIAPSFARATEIYALRRTAVTFLDTYVGRGAGERILNGSIHRGDIEEIDAVILAADLRGFSAYSNVHDSAEVVTRLNAFFDLLVPPIVAQEGEVLKFTGDGLLAIFPYEGAADAPARCRRALTAARTAVVALAASSENDDAFRCGIALHPGRVSFGNVGSDQRLDFTAIGASVNLAVRLEAVAGDLGRSIVVSADFAGFDGGKFEALGEYSLKGFDGLQPVFAPSD